MNKVVLAAVLFLTYSLNLQSELSFGVNGLSFFDHADSKFIASVQLRDVTPRAARSRRSTDNMPDHLHFDFSTGSEVISLRLRRSAQINMASVPVYTVRDGQNLHKEDLPPTMDAAVYSDIRNGAAMLVRRPQYSQQFQVQGTFHVGGQPFMITPNVSDVQEAQESVAEHELRQMQTGVSYGSDYIDVMPEGDDGTNNLRRGKRQMNTLPFRNTMLTNLGRIAASDDDDDDDNSKNKLSNNGQIFGPTSKYNIDVNVVCDYGCYKRFYDRHNNQQRALEEVRMYFSYLVQSVDLRFRTITDINPRVVIGVTPVSIIAATTAEGSSYSTNNLVEDSNNGVDGNDQLQDFRAWHQKQKELPNAATTILQTGYNMMTNGETYGQLGLAYRGGACTQSNVVVVEEKFDGITGMITAHELGHSVSSKHDGTLSDEDDACDDDSGRYVMSAYIGVPIGSTKPWHFSPCSAKDISNFVSNTRAYCFPDKVSAASSEFAGQIYTADDQCALAKGAGNFFCRGRHIKESKNYDGICSRMYCSDTPTTDNTCNGIIPLEFTSCGDKKWCVGGNCVPDSRAPSKVADSCAQGDDPSYRCSASVCFSSVSKDVFCCETCKQSRPGTPPLGSPTLPGSNTGTQFVGTQSGTQFVGGSPVGNQFGSPTTTQFGGPTSTQFGSPTGTFNNGPGSTSNFVGAGVPTSNFGGNFNNQGSFNNQGTGTVFLPGGTLVGTTTNFVGSNQQPQTSTFTNFINRPSPQPTPPPTTTTTTTTTTTATPPTTTLDRNLQQLPTICRQSRVWCQYCILVQFRYPFCRV